MKKLIVFDLDGTLAPSKSSLAPETAALVHDLLGIIKVAVISGARGPSLKSSFSRIFPKAVSSRTCPCFQLVGQNSSSTKGSGRSFIQRI